MHKNIGATTISVFLGAGDGGVRHCREGGGAVAIRIGGARRAGEAEVERGKARAQ